MPFRALRYFAIVFLAQFIAIAADSHAQGNAGRQDSVRRVVVKMSAREIPAVDYEKLFKEASPIERPQAAVGKKRSSGNKSTKLVTSGTAGKPPLIVARAVSKPKPVKLAEKMPAAQLPKAQPAIGQQKPLMADKPVRKKTELAPREKPVIAEKPVQMKPEPVVKKGPAKIADRSVAPVAKTTAKPVVMKQKPLLAEKTVQKAAASAQSPIVGTKSKTVSAQDAPDDKTLAANVEGWQNKVNETAAMVQKDISKKASEKPEGENEYNRAISAEQARWDALADSQIKGESDPIMDENTTDSKMSYLYIGFGLTVIGVILGLVFGRPAFLVSVVGVVFVVIGLFIRA